MNANSNDADTLNHLAIGYLNQGKLEEAIACLQQVVTLNPDSAEAHFNLGIALTQQDKLELAFACFQTVLAFNPNSAEAYFNLGFILEQKDKLELAIACFQKSLELLPDDADTYKSLGNILIKAGQFDEAIAYLQKALQLQPDSVESYSNLLLQLAQQGNLDTAIAAAIQALQIKPEWKQAYLYIGYALQQKGRNKEALDCGLGLLGANLIKEFLPSIPDWKVTSKSASDNQITYLPIHPQNKIYLSPPRTIDSNIHTNFLQASLEFPATFVAIIPNGRIWVDFYTSAIITSDNQLVEDVSTGNGALIVSSNQLPAVADIDGVVACLAIRYSHNYFHWMFDLLPRLELLRLSGIEISSIDKFIVNCYCYSFQIETLNSLGIPQEKIMYDRVSHLQAKSLIVPSSPFNRGKIPKETCNFLRSAFLNEKAIEKLEKPDRIYISRQSASYRRVINEDEVSNFLVNFGFESIALESMSFNEQISQMAAAKVVIAPHGAGLTNLVFCSPGTKVIEIFLPNEVLDYYWIVSDRIGLEYYYLIGDTVEEPASLNQPGQISIVAPQENIFINLDSLLNLMKFAGVA